MTEKTPLLELLELAWEDLQRINRREQPRMSVEELASLIWWTNRLRGMKQSGTATRH